MFPNDKDIRMTLLHKFKPAFWNYGDKIENHSHKTFNFARKWKLIVFFTSFMALLPLFVMTLVEFSLTRHIIEDEVKTNMARLLDSAVTSISFSSDPDTYALNYITRLNAGKENDIFVVNNEGVLLTSSYFYGSPGISQNAVNAQLFKGQTGILNHLSCDGKPVIAGFSKIPDMSFILVLVKSEKWITDLYFKPRLKLAGYLVISIVLILLSIMGTSTFLVGRIHAADRRRVEALHHAEYANKLASIGRLASGVAHEINNPLAIINQKTGLIMDLLALKIEFSSDDRLILLANDVLDAVNRCSTITRRLLEFSRQMEPKLQPVDIGEIIRQTLAFLEKEAERRAILISVDNKDPVPGFECDKGSLQQIFLNLFDNAFDAMKDGGKLDIAVRQSEKKNVIITVSDNGIGIPENDIHKIFEPFYSSKNDHWGAGHGLSITYGLVKEIRGDIRVQSKLGKGTCFTLTLPLKANHDKK